MIPITDSVMTSGVKYFAPLGNSSKQYRSMPNVPTLSSTPTSSTAAPGGAEAAASGSQVWNGHSGALMRRRWEEARNSHFCTTGLAAHLDQLAEQERAGGARTAPLRAGVTYSAMIATA